MKKFFVFLFLSVLVSGLFAQTKPFIGYDKAAWGSSIADVQKMYNLQNINAVPQKEDPNISIITQKNVSSSISEREFLFNCGKLYRVLVFYGGFKQALQDDLLRSLKNAITEKYGKESDTGYKTYDNTDYNLGVITFEEKSTIYSRFSPDIEVEIFYTTGKSFYPYAITMTDIKICYTWKKFRDEYQASKIQL